MKKITKNEKSKTGGQTRLRPNKKTATPISQRAASKQKQPHTLKDSELRYRYLFEHMLNGFAYCKMIFEQGRPQDFIYLDVNSAFESLTGLKNVTGKKVSEVIPGIRESDPGLIELYGRVALTGNPERLETYVEALKKWFLISVYSPRKEYFVAVFDVITERKKAEEMLMAERDLLTTLINILPDNIFVKDVVGRIIMDNSAHQRTLGVNTLEQVVGKTDFDFFPGELAAQFDADEKQVVRSGEALIDKVEPFFDKDNNQKWLLTTKVPLRDRQGNITGIVGFNRDIADMNERNLLRTLIDNLPDIIYVKDIEGRFMLKNLHDARRMGASSPEEMIGKTDFDYYSPELSAQYWADDQTVLHSGQPIVNREEPIVDATGRSGWISTTKVPFRDPQGKVIGLVGIGHDITERKQAEEMLMAERDLLTTLLNTHPDSIFIKDVMGRIVMDNSAHRRTLGANTLEEVVGKTDFDFHPREHAAQYDADEKQVIQSGEPLIDKSEPFIDRDNNQRWLLTTKVPLRDRQGNIMGIVGFNRDITERKQAEEALLNERNLLRTLIDNLPDIVYVKDIEGRFLLKNLRDARQMGASSPEETIGKTDFDYYSHELAAQYWADDQAVFHSGQPIVNREEPIVDATTGRSGWISTTKVPLRNPQGKVIGLVGIGHDITERKRTGERIQRQLQHLAALRAIDQVVSSSFDLHFNLTWILESVTKELGVDAADVLTLNSVSTQLEYGAGVGFRTKAAEKASVRLGHSYAGRVALERQLIQIPDLNEQPPDLQSRTKFSGEDFVSYYGIPLIAKGSVKGVLEIFHRTRLDPDQEWFDFLNTLAGQAALAIDNANLFENLQRSNIDLTLAYDATIEGWSHAMDLRDKETEGHTQRVTALALELAGLFGIKDEELVGVRRGALLHDIGKMGVPDGILLKTGALTDEEWILMKKHPALAFEMLSPIRYLRSAIDIPYCHHEKWDGTGYPRGLKGEQIPLSARIFSIIDVWDALTSDRPYRKAWPKEKAIEYLKSEAGTSFDPQVVKICIETGVFDRKARK